MQQHGDALGAQRVATPADDVGDQLLELELAGEGGGKLVEKAKTLAVGHGGAEDARADRLTQ